MCIQRLLWLFTFSGCRHNEVISNLLQPDDVTALFGNTPFHIVEQSLSFWCIFGQDGNHINMTFSQPVVMEEFTTNGGTSFSGTVTVEHYVSNFSILYSESMDGPLHRYPSVRIMCTGYTNLCILISFLTFRISL